MTIDMKDYAGEYATPAAVEQQPSNSYERNEHEFPVLPPEAEPVPETVLETATPVQEDLQALNFKALSDSVERLKTEREAEKREHQLQLDMLRVNLARQQSPEKPANQMFEGMEDTEIPNVGELRRAWQDREKAYNEKIEELQVANANPDYAQVLNKYGKHLAETDPVFLQGLEGAKNKAQFAYQYAKKVARIEELEARLSSQITPPQPSVTAQRIVENSRKPGTLAQAGGQNVLSKTDYYATMSDQEFMRMASKHLETI